MKLLVDMGNSRVKWACAEGDALSRHGACSYTQGGLGAMLEQRWQGLPAPAQIHFASVAPATSVTELRQYARMTWQLEAQQAVTEKARAGLCNAYADVQSMGVDRWLAMLAAWSRHNQALCVIDCGTALTVDLIRADGQHVGGFILPGLSLMASALAGAAHGIHKRPQQALQLAPGRSTMACINNGFAVALAGLLERCCGEIRPGHGVEPLCVITGGGAQQLLPLLPEPCIHEPHLVLQGLMLSCEPA